MSFRSINFNWHTKFFAQRPHLREPFLIVGSASAHKNLYFVFHKLLLVFLERLDYTFEGSGYVCEICYSAADEQELAFWVWFSSHQVKDGFGV